MLVKCFLLSQDAINCAIGLLKSKSNLRCARGGYTKVCYEWQSPHLRMGNTASENVAALASRFDRPGNPRPPATLAMCSTIPSHQSRLHRLTINLKQNDGNFLQTVLTYPSIIYDRMQCMVTFIRILHVTIKYMQATIRYYDDMTSRFTGKN